MRLTDLFNTKAILVALPLAAGIALMVMLRGTNSSRQVEIPRMRMIKGEAFLGHYRYVIHLPKDYAAFQQVEPRDGLETVYFGKSSIDPTNFEDEGLYGPLGIIRLEVRANSLVERPNALERLSSLINEREQRRGTKFRVKEINILALRGLQINYDGPPPRVEAYVLGQKQLYSFLAGQEDEIFREILFSLREEAQSES
ncbi:MAG: hypothetical protein HY549_11625 [Elusimicrobia bacterium]|nr:hypothetical protein [Elusimicrobiota bacterium]